MNGSCLTVWGVLARRDNRPTRAGPSAFISGLLALLYPAGMKQISFDHLTTAQPQKHEYEFQQVCAQLQPIYGIAIWTLPYQVGVTPFKIKKAARFAKNRGVETLPYLKGIIKNLPD